MSIFLNLNMRAGRSRAGVLGLLGLTAIAFVAVACGVESGASAIPAESPAPDGAVASAEESPDAAPTTVEVVEARAETNSAASSAAPSDASGPPETPEKNETPGTDEPPETLMLSPELTDFTLPSGLGNEVTLSSYLGEQNVMVVFYRAWW